MPPPTHGRLAPSPTGAQHVGNARTYLIAWLSARSRGGAVTLRVEDIDSPRVKAGAADQAVADLLWLGLDWDGEPVVQTKRLDIYTKALAELKRLDLVYPCTCTRADAAAAASAPHADGDEPAYPGTCSRRTPADADRLDKPFAWRFRVADTPEFVDCYAGPKRVDLKRVGGDFVVWKVAGTPAYQLAAAVDDGFQTLGITEVVRGDDLISSTPRQILLACALQLTPPEFAHVPLVVGPDGRRLAKRHGDTRLSALREAGVRPADLVGLLAWSCGWLDRPRPITPKELLPRFRLDRIPPIPFVLTPDLLAGIGYRAAEGATPPSTTPMNVVAPRGGTIGPAGAETTPHGETPATPKPEPARPPAALGGYRIVRELGRGGMGVVYEAEDEQLRRRVALKVMHPRLAENAASRERFLREARAMAAVEHDYIVPVFQIGDAAGTPFLAMPLLNGETLDQRLMRDPVPLPEVLVIARQVAEGLAATHERGLIHRDVKPSNIWLERDANGKFKRVRLLDFGLVRSSREEKELTGYGVFMGTPIYVSPEQVRNSRDVDYRADLFSLGRVMYHLATHQLPFRGMDSEAILHFLQSGQRLPPAGTVNPRVPKKLSRLIDRLLTPDREARAVQVWEVIEELDRIAHSRWPW